MIRHNLLAIGLVSILALTGCKTAETTADSAGKAVTDSTSAMKDTAKDAAGAAKDAAGTATDKVAGAAGAAKDKVTDAAGAAKDKATDAAGAAKDKVAGAAGAAKDKVASATGAVAAPEMANVAGVVTKTKAAIDAGDFEQAKSEMSKFEDSWKKVEDGVKSKSSAAYDAIETNANSARSAVNNEDKAKALEALKALGTAIASAKP